LARHTNVDREQEIQTRERLTRLWLEAEPAVRAYVGAAVREFHDAEDVVQQVALTAARRFDEFDASRPFLAWVLWLAKSRIVDHYRQQARERRLFSEGLLDRLAAALVSQQAELPARQAALERCLERLPEKSHRLLTLRYAEDASVAVNSARIWPTCPCRRTFSVARSQLAARNASSSCISPPV
jgi:RNA polymerase sigma-70 factor, ECF subfamily